MHRLNSGQGKRPFNICPVRASQQNEASQIIHAVLARSGFLPSNLVAIVLNCSSAIQSGHRASLVEKEAG